jgi:hypothetical protein
MVRTAAVTSAGRSVETSWPLPSAITNVPHGDSVANWRYKRASRQWAERNTLKSLAGPNAPLVGRADF